MFLPTIAAGGHNTHFIDINNKLWACGSNKSCQLGVTGGCEMGIPKQVEAVENVKLVSSGMDHTLILDLEGNVWGCGNNLFKQAYPDGSDSYTSMTRIPTKFENISEIDMMSCGDHFSLLLGVDGEVFACGKFSDNVSYKTATVLNMPTRVKYLSCGKTHAMALDYEGNAWGMGSNNTGQLGLKQDIIIHEFTMVPNLPQLNAVSCGGYHTMVLDNDGFAHCVGKNFEGQLGLGDTKTRYTFEKVESLSEIQQIAAGGLHSLFLDMQGDPWSCGYEVDGQLGFPPVSVPQKAKNFFSSWFGDPEEKYKKELAIFHLNTAALHSPRKINLSNIQFISAGYLHSIFLDTSGHLWVCGYNDFGQLATGDTLKRFTPTRIQNVPEILTILRESAGVKNARKS